MKKLVMYGAGNIGRGFIGQIFGAAGYEIIFVDVDEKIVTRFNTDRLYPVVVVSNEGKREIIVENVRAVNGRDGARVAEEIAGCDIMATAVGVNVLKFIAEPIAKGIELRLERKRPPMDIIICENLIDADKIFRDLISEKLENKYRKKLNENVGFVESSVGRMVPIMSEKDKADNPLRVFVESYDTLPVDKDAFKNSIPNVSNLLPYSPFRVYIERKLFMHNMSHATAAYLGAVKGVEYIYQAIGQDRIRNVVGGALNESAKAMSIEHGADLNMLKEHAEDLISRYQNVALGDTVARVGHDTIRKLGVNDRLVGALKLCVKHGIYPENIMRGIAAALRFDKDAASGEVAKYCKECGVAAALEKYSGLGKEYDYYASVIAEMYH